MEATAFALTAVVAALAATWALVVARRALAGREIETGLRARAELEPIRTLRRAPVPASDRTVARAA